MKVVQSKIRVYVACLASYNDGILHGRWIDAESGADHIHKKTKSMLERSPIEHAEEWAIHDYEGFEGLTINEYDSFEHVASLASFIDKHGKLGSKLLDYYSGNIEDATTAFDYYLGQYQSASDYVEQYLLDTDTSIPDHLIPYIDYEKMARDLQMSGDITIIETGFEEVHVFSAW